MEFCGKAKPICFSLIIPKYVLLCLQALLEVVNDLFEEQTDLEKIVKKIMHRAQTLLKCERCSVLLLEDIESPVSYPQLPMWSQRLGGRKSSSSAIKLASRAAMFMPSAQEGMFSQMRGSFLKICFPFYLVLTLETKPFKWRGILEPG